jgi:DNA helicase-2/ATP-dependent DNA helicase PcrA
MAWDDNLPPEQRAVAGHTGSHARLLAGPGTGKTRCLTRRICYLIEDGEVQPDQICALTFTRAAAYELGRRVEAEVGAERPPRISTLHSFALRQLLRNSTRLAALPQPLRIADDWEERNIVLEDLKAMLGLPRIRDARGLLNELSADWQRLTADEADWDTRFPTPEFLGAWREHRGIYAYVLRSELVYQLKHALEQDDDFDLEGPPVHLLVDEYQDLNRCDLAVVKAIADCGAEVYAAGDDDQSIYGFRKAHPEGIRRFLQDYPGASGLSLEMCKRCDREIMDLGLFVARQDIRRIDKPLCTDPDRVGGHVAILGFRDQAQESRSVACLCQHLISHHGLQPHEILILLRSDRYGAFSTVLRDALSVRGVPVGIATADSDPFNGDAGRQVLAVLRLLDNQADSLAWRTLLLLRRNNLGSGTMETVYERARANGVAFSEALREICSDPSSGRGRAARMRTEFESINAILDELATRSCAALGEQEEIDLLDLTQEVATRIVDDEAQRQAIVDQLGRVTQTAQPASLNELLRAIESSAENIEQELDPGRVNILTMHKAKGLTAEAVIIVAAEDEYLPGRAAGDDMDDERRLLYVSLTRAKHHLYITYCNERTGRQQHTGRTVGNTRRHLTRFLQDAPLRPQRGVDYVHRLQGRIHDP